MQILIAFALTSLASSAQTRDFEWHGPVARGSFIEIRGINGDVRALPSATGEVEVFAKFENQETATKVDVQLVRHEKGVTICTVFPGESECRALGEPGPGVRVNYEVHVPEGVDFLGSTVNGGVEAESLNSDVEAITVNGQVKVSTSGTLQARTVNGSITASLLKPFWSKPAQLSTINGAIRLVLPPCAGTALEAATKNGRIVTDFNAKGKVTDQEVIGRIGAVGGKRVVLRTINGSIELKRGV